MLTPPCEPISRAGPEFERLARGDHHGHIGENGVLVEELPAKLIDLCAEAALRDPDGKDGARLCPDGLDLAAGSRDIELAHGEPLAPVSLTAIVDDRV